MTIGKLRNTVSFQTPSQTQDAFGQQQPDTWTTVYQCRACIVPFKSRDLYAVGAGFTAQNYFKVTIRFPASVSITTAMRIMWGSEVLILESAPVDPDGRHHWLEITAILQDK